jgi:two-component system response regulator MtrA
MIPIVLCCRFSPGRDARSVLAAAGYAVRSAAPRALLLAARRLAPAAVLLEVGGPPAALDACLALKRDPETRGIPVLALCPDSQAVALQVEAFAAGADDCLAGPPDATLLVAHVGALRRRLFAAPGARPLLRVGALCLDLDAGQVRVGEDPWVPLTRAESALLEAFMRRPGVLQGRLALLNHVRRSFADSAPHTVDTHVANLRRKLGGGRLIETRRGLGWRLRSDG